MKEYLKVYEMKITVKSPIHIGNSVNLTKKEYLNDEKESVSIIDLNKMFLYITQKKLLKQYENYVMTPFKSLKQWVEEMKIPKMEYDKWKKYKLKKGDTFLSNNRDEKKEKGISCFIKDAYDMPYVPGSSIKGMIRNALLIYEIEKNKNKFSGFKNRIESFKPNRKKTLKEEIEHIETEVFHTFKNDIKNKKNAINSNMAGLIIGDSKPISTEQLSLYQKIDHRKDGKENRINLLRECLTPKTEIFFTISIDTKIFPYTIEEIMDALDIFNEKIYHNYYSKFNKGALDDGTIWLGGGVGFVTKTIVHPLFENDATRIIAKIFKETGVKGNLFGKEILPYATKCTKEKGMLVDMGRGKIEIIKECD